MIKYSIETSARKTTCLVVPVWEDLKLDTLSKQIDKQFDGMVSDVISNKDFEGKKLQTSLIYTKNKDVPRIFLIGLGDREDAVVRNWKRALGAAVIAVQAKKIERITVIVPHAVVKTLGAKKMGYESALAVETAHYAFDEYKEKEAKVTRLKELTLVVEDGSKKRAAMSGVQEGLKVAEAVNLVRSLGNMPPSEMVPERLAKEAQKVADSEPKLTARILSESQIEKLGMGCFLGVASGSQHGPKFIILTYNGGPKSQKPIVLVGKGVTFDSGGLSIKPSEYLCDMKFDMLGAATVIGTLKAAASLGLKKNVIGLAPTCENMPGGEAYRPDDILRAMNGKTVEVKNTDAEGRLILADALCYAKKFDPKEVIDLATLTGACMVAVGLERSGLFCADDTMANKLYQSAQAVGEELWRLPLGEEYHELMKSQVADIANISPGRYGGASTGAAFLEFFTDYPWAHIDMSSAFLKGEGKPWIRHGAIGFGVQTLIEYLR